MRLDAKHFTTGFFGFVAVLAGLVWTTGAASAAGSDYIPSLDIIPTATFATGDDEKVVNNTGGAQPFQDGHIMLNMIFTQPLGKRLNLQLQQNRTSGYDVTLGSAAIGGSLVYPGAINDSFEEARLNYTATKNIGITAGYNYRWRTCCPNAGQNGNNTPTVWRGYFMQLNLSTPPIKALNGTTITGIVHSTYNHFHNSPAFQAEELAEGVTPNGGTARFPTWYGITASVPINSGLTIYGLEGFGAFDYFDNSISPYYYDLVDFGMVKSINKYLSFTASIDSLSQQHLEANNPFPLPNGIHRVYLATGLDVHLGK